MNASTGLNGAIAEIYEAALEPARWPQALRAIADCFGDPAAVLTIGRDDGTFALVGPPGAEAALDAYKQSWSHRDTRALRARARGYLVSGEVITDRDILDPGERETDPFYTQYLQQFKQGYFAGASVTPDPRVEVALSIHRRLDREDFSPGELQTVGLLAQHVERALRLSIKLMDAQLVNSALGDALARIGLGVFALDSLGRVVFTNAAAQALLGNGVDVLNQRLVVHAKEDRDAFADASRKILAQSPSDYGVLPGPVLVRRANGQRPLVVYLMPVAASLSAANLFLTHARILLLIVDPKTDALPEPSLVRDFLGLTLSEARVASLISSGLPPRDAAARLGITEETARTALKRVFSKTGITRQSELAALIARLVLR